MHEYLSTHANDFRRSASGHELTVIADGRVGKVVRVEHVTALRAVDIDGVNGWAHFHWLTDEEARHLTLPNGRWLLTLRSFTPGESLADAIVEDASSVALKLAYRVRDLHEVGQAHGDLQPGNVIVADGEVWLIDLSATHTQPGDLGHVAGSAPLMAPELWSGGAPSFQSDVYALGCMTAWLLVQRFPHHGGDLAAWAKAHRDGEPDLAGLPAPIAGVVRRALSRDPAERPPIQSLIDALRAHGASGELPPMVAGGLHPIDIQTMAAAMASPAHLHIVGPPRSGRTFTARALTAALAADGRAVIAMQGQSALTGHEGDDDDPWRAVASLLKAVAWQSGTNLEFPDLGRGDRLWGFDQLTQTLLTALGNQPVSIVWDDFDEVRPDTRAWWSHVVDAIGRRQLDISTVVLSSDGVQVPVVRTQILALSAAEWNRWRAKTLRTEVRDANQAQWDQLVASHGARIGVMLGMLDREIGARHVGVARPRRELDTGTLRSMQSGWRERVAQLSARCAFDEVIETVSTLYGSLQARGSVDAATTHDLLDAWTSAVVAGGGGGTQDALLDALALHVASPRIAVHLARLANSLGRHAEGLSALQGVTSADPAVLAEVAAWKAQLALSLGRPEEVRTYTAEGRDYLTAATRSVAAQLQVLALAPDAMTGDAGALGALSDLAPSLEHSDVPPIVRARLHAYRALGLTRVGALDEASDAHLRALEQVERGGLSAELPTYLLNVGTAYHRQGRLGLAREYYGRGLRVAQATTRASTRALLHANQANVDLALGRFDEARIDVRRALEIARMHELAQIEVMGRSVDADIELAGGNPSTARAMYLEILVDAPRLGAGRHQVAEVELAVAESALLVRDAPEAALRLDQARTVIEEGKFIDLDHLHGILRARLQWLEGGSLGTMAGIELFRRSLLAAEESGNHRVVLRQAPLLLGKLEQEGLDELQEEIGNVVQRSRNAIAMGLGKELRRDFFANLPTPKPFAAPAPVSDATDRAGGPASTAVEPFYRMLSLNEVILRGESLSSMLPDALQIAMSLSHAERGFILLRDDLDGRVGTFRVAASRDVDGDAIPSPHLAVSLTIAEEAARTGRTVLTLNAREDGRFSEALSVVDLDLTSVLCVPVRDGSGLLGAMYLDHRFRPGVFESEVPRMMEAFGHQLALAITNARRLEELVRMRTELAEALRERDSMLVGLERRVTELTEEVERKHSDRTLRDVFPEIAFGSRAMERVLSQVERVARGEIPVVVTGESGVGKELIARAVHQASPRRGGPFVAFNCGAVSESLFESEMFGHIKGAFTGADTDRQGLFQAAGTGTIFLDEIGEMPASVQVKLLRVLQERQLRRVGESHTVAVDVRVVAATNRDLLQMVRDGTFREDLYYRLAAFVIEVPPLRERREDIPLIAAKLLERVSVEAGRELRLTPGGARLLAQCEWYGNVRELENTLRTAAVMADGHELGEAEVAPLVRLRAEGPHHSAPTRAVETRGRRRKADRLDVVEAMRRAGDDRAAAAAALGVSERTLYRYLKQWDLY